MLISIIVPVYKVDYKKLKDCIESLINQSYKKIEIILVDDGSPDDCPNICNQYAEKDKRIKVIHQQNKGLSGARNSGVKISQGKYYTFVDGDDYLYQNAITAFVSQAQKTPADIICSQLISASSTEDINNFPYKYNKIYSSEKDLKYLLKMLINFNGNNNSACGKLYSKEFTEKHQIFHNEELKQGAEDLEFNFRMFSMATKIVFMKERVYQCVYNASSITRSFSIKNEYLKLNCFKQIKANIGNDKELTSYLNTRILYMIVNSAISGFFNPSNSSNYHKQKVEFKIFINDELLTKVLYNEERKKIDKSREFIIFMIKHHFYIVVKICAILRFYQKKYRK